MLSSLAVTPAAGPPDTPPCENRQIALSAPLTDPIIAQVSAWLAERVRAEALLAEWQRLEHARSLKRGDMGLAEAARRGFPESRQMKQLDRRYDKLCRKFDRAAGRIVAARAQSPAGRLAKLEMALQILEPMDCEEFSWPLIRGGYEDLRGLL